MADRAPSQGESTPRNPNELGDDEVRQLPEYVNLQNKFEEWYTGTSRKPEDKTFVVSGVSHRVAMLFLVDRQEEIGTNSVDFSYTPEPSLSAESQPEPEVAAPTKPQRPEVVANLNDWRGKGQEWSDPEWRPQDPKTGEVDKDRHPGDATLHIGPAPESVERFSDALLPFEPLPEFSQAELEPFITEYRKLPFDTINNKRAEKQDELLRTLEIVQAGLANDEKLAATPAHSYLDVNIPPALETVRSLQLELKALEILFAEPVKEDEEGEEIVEPDTSTEKVLTSAQRFDAIRKEPRYSQFVESLRQRAKKGKLSLDTLEGIKLVALKVRFVPREKFDDYCECFFADQQPVVPVTPELEASTVSQVEVPVVDTVAPEGSNELERTQRISRQLKEKRELFESEPFQFLSQLSIKGMPFNELMSLTHAEPRSYHGPTWVKQYLDHPLWSKAAGTFRRTFQEGFRPAANFMLEYVLEHPKFTHLGQLNAESEKEGKKKFADATKNLWGKFYYSGKWKRDQHGKVELVDTTDLDAKVTLALFQRAGIKGTDLAKAIPPGEVAYDGTVLDTGGIAGVMFERNMRDVEGSAPEHIMMLVADNHQPYRDLVETSTAKIVYQLLAEGGLLDRRDLTARVLADMTVLDDNARFIETREQFENSDHTIRGLHRYFEDPKHLQGYIMQVVDKAKKAVPRDEPASGLVGKFKPRPWSAYYADIMKYVLDSEISHDDIVKLKVGDWVQDKKKSRSAQREVKAFKPADELQRATIENAHELLGRSDAELQQAGQLLELPGLGRTYVELADKHPKLRGGHDALKAYGFDAGLSFDETGKSFLVNLLRDKGDLSEVFSAIPQGAFVRGVMLIKPRDGKELQVTLGDLLRQAGFTQEQVDAHTKTVEAYVRARSGSQPGGAKGNVEPAKQVEPSPPAVPESAIPPQAERAVRLENDARYYAIEQELIRNWEAVHGSRYEEHSTMLRPEFYDYLMDQGESKGRSLAAEVKNIFAQRYPDDNRFYHDLDGKRMFDNPSDDPAVQALRRQVLLEAAKVMEHEPRAKTKAQKAARLAKYYAVVGELEANAWSQFASQYPEKAQAYQGKVKVIEQAPAVPPTEESAPPDHRKPEAEPFTVAGIEFTRALDRAEANLVAGVDAAMREILVTTLTKHFRVAVPADRLEATVQSFVDQGMLSPEIMSERRIRYQELGLPIAEAGA